MARLSRFSGQERKRAGGLREGAMRKAGEENGGEHERKRAGGPEGRGEEEARGGGLGRAEEEKGRRA